MSKATVIADIVAAVVELAEKLAAEGHLHPDTIAAAQNVVATAKPDQQAEPSYETPAE